MLEDVYSTGATFKELSGCKRKGVKIVVPPLAERQRIVSILDSAFDDISGAKVETELKLIALEELKKSLLHQAFTGQLVTI